MPDREQRFAAMLDAVEAVAGGRPPRVLDLAGGTGPSRCASCARCPDARMTLLDVDPVLLTLARALAGGPEPPRDCRPARIPPGRALPTGYDAVVTATALHWLPAARLASCTPSP